MVAMNATRRQKNLPGMPLLAGPVTGTLSPVREIHY
jgi:hypothetical protein